MHCLGLIHGAPKGRSEDDRRKTLLKWTQCTRSERVTMFMTKTEMQAFATDKGLNDQMKWSRSVLVLRADLANLLHRLEYGDDGDDIVEIEAGENGYLAEFLRSAFLQPAKKGRGEGQTQYMAQGHRAEKPFLKEFFEITQKYDVARHQVEAVYSPGAVMSRKRMFNRDSSDGVVIYSTYDDAHNRRSYGAKPAEVKARVIPRTFARERNNIIQVKQMLIDDESDSTCFYSRGAADEPIYALIDAICAVNSEDDSDDSDDKEQQDLQLNPILQAAIPGKEE